MKFAPKKILVPLDFSTRSEIAVNYAHAVAEHFGADLILLHVLEDPPFGYAMIETQVGEPTLPERREKFEALLSAVGSKLGGVRRLIAEGDPADCILETAAMEQAGLIVMPTQGHNRIRQLLIGSVTAKVLHDSPIPVCTGVHLHREGNFPDFQLRNILCAIDFGPQSAGVLRHAASLTEHFRAALTVTHVLFPRSGGRPTRELTVAEEDAAARLKLLLREGAADAHAVIEFGRPADTVARVARETAADLVIIGRGCSRDLAGRLRAEAYAIVRQSPCPVLSV